MLPVANHIYTHMYRYVCISVYIYMYICVNKSVAIWLKQERGADCFRKRIDGSICRSMNERGADCLHKATFSQREIHHDYRRVPAGAEERGEAGPHRAALSEAGPHRAVLFAKLAVQGRRELLPVKVDSMSSTFRSEYVGSQAGDAGWIFGCEE